jgi:hypothetical protein
MGKSRPIEGPVLFRFDGEASVGERDSARQWQRSVDDDHNDSGRRDRGRFNIRGSDARRG